MKKATALTMAFLVLFRCFLLYGVCYSNCIGCHLQWGHTFKSSVNEQHLSETSLVCD